MEIEILNRTKRNLNRSALLASCGFAIGFFGWALITIFDKRIAALVLFVGLVFLALYLLLAFTGWLYRPKKEITVIERLCLHVNSNVSLDKIEKPNDIQFSNNFLVDVKTGETVVELDRKRAYELLCSREIDCKQVEHKLSFFQHNPNGVIGVVLEWC